MSPCAECGKQDADTKCPNCRVAVYCNKKCLKAHKKHKKSGECAALANARTAQDTAEQSSGSGVELLTAQGELSPLFHSILTTLFERFDRDEDGLLSDAELKAYSAAANEDGRQFDQEEIDQIRDCFDCKPGGLTLDGWLDMYHTQTGGDEVCLLTVAAWL